MNQELLVHFSGHVQGCGFRYYTFQLMGSHLVSGYVKNLFDGRVELVLQGKMADVVAALDDVKDRMSGNIVSAKTDWREITEEFREFEIRY